MLQHDEVGHGIIAIGKIERLAFVTDLAFMHFQLGGVSMHDFHTVPVAKIPGQLRLFVWAAAGVLRLNEAQTLSRPADRLQVIEHFLHEQLANVFADGQLQLAIPGMQLGENDVADDVFTSGNQMQPANAAQVGFDEVKRVLPHRADKVDHRVQPAEDRVAFALARTPRIPQPGFLLRSQPQQVANGEVLHIQFRQTLEGIQDRQRNRMHVCQLAGKDRDRAGHDSYGVPLPVAKVDQVPAERLLADALDQLDQLGFGDFVKGLANPTSQAQSAQSELFRGS